jgi:hypothetical protein
LPPPHTPFQKKGLKNGQLPEMQEQGRPS